MTATDFQSQDQDQEQTGWRGPDAQQAERALLGLLLDSATYRPEILAEVMAIIHPTDLINAKHQRIVGAMMELDMENQSFGLVEVFQKLGGPKGPVEVDYLVSLSRFATEFAVSFQILDYAQQVREASERRSLIKAAERIAQLARNGEYGNTRELFSQAEEILARVEPTDIARTGLVPVTSLLDSYFDQLVTRYEIVKAGGKPQMGLLTNLLELDMLWTGLKRNKYYVIAARPAMGKTAFLLHLLLEVTRQENVYAAFFSVEMAKDEEMINRMVSNRGKVDNKRLQTGVMQDDDWPRITEAIAAISPRLYIDDTAGMTMTHIKREARKLRRQIGKEAELVVAVDYLQLVSGPKHLRDDEYKLTSYVSKQLNDLKKELNCTVIALSQLNRELEKRQDKRPQKSDLRGSGQIEQDADLIAFLYRDEVYNPKTEHKGVVEVITDKQRAGKTGTVKLTFLDKIGRYESFAPPNLLAGA